ncbi:MAG: dodecin family protein [Euzebya sp.]
MSVARVTEITSRSESSFDDAVAVGLQRAQSTLRNVEHAWIKDQEVYLKDSGHTYQVTMKITFQLDD